MTDENLKRISKELRIVEEFGDLPDDELSWLANHVEEKTFNPGECVSKEGDPADDFIILIDGLLQYRRDSDTTDNRVWDMEPGEVGGKLPYSRLTHYAGSVRAAKPSRVLVGSVDVFPEMIRDAPLLTQRLVGMMRDRTRWVPESISKPINLLRWESYLQDLLTN